MRRLVPAVALVLLLTSCASAGPASTGAPTTGDPTPGEPMPTASADAEPAPRFIGAADDGATFSLEVDQTTTLRATDAEASDPELDGESVLVIPVANITSSAGREWEIRAVAPGTSTLTGTDAGEKWTITLTVSE